MDAFTLGVDPVDGDRPRGVAIDRGKVPARPARQLVLEECEEPVRSAAQPHHAVRNARRFHADRHGRRPRELGHEHERVAAPHAAERAELVPGDEHEAGRDTRAPQLLVDPPRGVGLVGDADLDVLHVARDARGRNAHLERGGCRDVDDLRQTGEAARLETQEHGIEEPVDAGLWRVVPPGVRDEVDLPAVQALRDDAGRQSARGEAFHDELRRGRERGVLPGRGADAVDEMHARRVHAEHLGPAVQQEEESAGSVRARGKLSVDVADVRARYDRDVHARRAQRLDETAHPAGVGVAIRDGSAVPVEDDGLESPAYFGTFGHARAIPCVWFVGRDRRAGRRLGTGAKVPPATSRTSLGGAPSRTYGGASSIEGRHAMMWWTGNWSWGWGVAMMAGTLAFWALVAWGIVLLARRSDGAEPPRKSAQDIVRERFAAGEISEEQYDSMLTALHSPAGTRH